MKILMAMVLAVLVGCDGEAYKEWSEEREAKKEAEHARAERDARLRQVTGGHDWQYLNDGDVQYADAGDVLLLRKVKSDDHQVVAYFTEDGIFATQAYWRADCEPGSQIETSGVYADGEPVMLECRRVDGETWLFQGSEWPGGGAFALNEDFGGFTVDEDFTTWDWTKTRQYATLQRAKMPEPEEERAE